MRDPRAPAYEPAESLRSSSDARRANREVEETLARLRSLIRLVSQQEGERRKRAEEKLSAAGANLLR